MIDAKLKRRVGEKICMKKRQGKILPKRKGREGNTVNTALMDRNDSKKLMDLVNK